MSIPGSDMNVKLPTIDDVRFAGSSPARPILIPFKWDCPSSILFLIEKVADTRKDSERSQRVRWYKIMHRVALGDASIKPCSHH